MKKAETKISQTVYEATLNWIFVLSVEFKLPESRKLELLIFAMIEDENPSEKNKTVIDLQHECCQVSFISQEGTDYPIQFQESENPKQIRILIFFE